MEAAIADYEAEFLPSTAATTQMVYASWLRSLRRCTVDGRPLPQMRLDELSPALVRRILAGFSTTPYNGGQIVGRLRSVIEHAIENGRFSGPNPARRVRGPRVRRRENPLDEGDARKLRRKLEDPEVGDAGARLLVRFLLLSGWRIGEARRLRIEHVNARTFERNRYAVVDLPSTKGGPQRRMISGAALSTVLQASGGRQSGFVFMRSEGRRVGRDGIAETLSRACEAAGIGRRVPHDLRHTFATFLLRRGAPRADVSRLLGHTNEATTLRYSHASTDDMRTALGWVDEIDEIGEGAA